MPGWTTLDELLSREFEQALEERKPSDAVAAIRGEYEGGARDEAAMAAAHEQLLALPVRDDFRFDESNELSAIQALRQSPRSFDVPAIDERLTDQLLGGWLGRCGGCALGKPVELIGLCPPAAVRQKTWRDIKHYLTAISPDEWPIKDFIPGSLPALGDMLAPLIAPLSTREQIGYMESDDDIRYTVLSQLVLAEKGAAFTTEDVADKWFQNVPFRAACTAETHAYRNLILRYDAHESTRWSVSQGIDWTWVAAHLNPYREWIGAQIRVDSYGYAAPGQSALAAEFAWRDARLSHVKNGIYGAMACAAMIAAAFATRDVREILAREPPGVIGLITPWNLPIAIPSWKLALARAFGNTGIMKPADLVPASAWPPERGAPQPSHRRLCLAARLARRREDRAGQQQPLLRPGLRAADLCPCPAGRRGRGARVPARDLSADGAALLGARPWPVCRRGQRGLVGAGALTAARRNACPPHHAAPGRPLRRTGLGALPLGLVGRPRLQPRRQNQYLPALGLPARPPDRMGQAAADPGAACRPARRLQHWLAPLAQRFFDVALDKGWDHEHGGICYGFGPESDGFAICDADKFFWVQAESLAAAALLAERTGEQRYWDWYDRIWAYSWAHFVDHQHGAWDRILSPSNTKLTDEKSPAGKTDYHTMGACYEVLNVLKA